MAGFVSITTKRWLVSCPCGHYSVLDTLHSDHGLTSKRPKYCVNELPMCVPLWQILTEVDPTGLIAWERKPTIIYGRLARRKSYNVPISQAWIGLLFCSFNSSYGRGSDQGLVSTKQVSVGTKELVGDHQWNIFCWHREIVHLKFA